MLFFFENLANTTTSIQNIDVDVFANNFNYLCAIDNCKSTATDGYTVFSRTNTTITDLINTSQLLPFFVPAISKLGYKGCI